MGTVPAAVEGSADKVTVVLAAAEDKQQADLVDVGCVQMAVVEAETVSAVARGAAEATVWSRGNWVGPVIQVYPGNFAAGPGWEDTAVVHTSTGQSVGPMLGRRVAGPEETPGLQLTEDPGIVGACGAADKAGRLARAKQMMEGGVVLGKESGHLVVLVETVNKESAAGLGEEPGWAGHNMVPALVSHTLWVPAVHRNPSKIEDKVLKHN